MIISITEGTTETSIALSNKEYEDFDKYWNKKPHLHAIGTTAILKMFLTNYRMGFNLNKYEKTLV